MQAISTARRLQDHQVWLAAIIIVLLGVLVAGAAMTMTRDDASTTTVKARPVTELKTNDNFRFVEMNTLPDYTAVRPVTYQNNRFREINMLPEAGTAPVVQFERWRLLEFNALPGDDAPLVAPSSDRRGVPY